MMRKNKLTRQLALALSCAMIITSLPVMSTQAQATENKDVSEISELLVSGNETEASELDADLVNEEAGEDQYVSGVWGENISWSLDMNTGHLDISGSGDMDPLKNEDDAWRQYYSSIQSVTIADGVTSVGSCAFVFCSSLNSIQLPESITSIDDNAFGSCGLSQIVIPNGTESIGDAAFSSCNSLSSVILSDSVKKIGNDAFNDC